LTAYENLELFARLYGLDVPTRRARIEQHLRAFELWDRRDERVGGFSKGMKQKIAIVRALIHEPDVLFFDEPTSGLDPIAAREVREMIASLKRQGRTILLTTHRLAEVEELADTVAIVRARLLALDSAANLKTRMFGRQAQVRVGNRSAALEETLRASPLLAAAAWENDVLTVPMADAPREMPALIRVLVAGGADVISAAEAAHSLEEVYLELVEEDA
jgi:ABC-2 type transport system ATP-binding protein